MGGAARPGRVWASARVLLDTAALCWRPPDLGGRSGSVGQAWPLRHLLCPRRHLRSAGCWFGQNLLPPVQSLPPNNRLRDLPWLVPASFRKVSLMGLH